MKAIETGAARGGERPEILEGRWKVRYDRVLGEGSFSVVYECEDLSLAGGSGDAPVLYAAHIMKPGAPDEVVSRIRHAARLIELLQDETLIRTKGFGTGTDGDAWFVTDLCSYPTLDAWVAGAADVDPASVLRLGRDVASALARIRQKFYSGDETRWSAIHRDLAPGNIHVVCEVSPEDGTYGPVRGVKINDWTLLREPGRRGRTELEQGGIRFGTPGFRAPEITRLEPPTIRSDIYSLGALMCFAATTFEPEDGRPPTAEDLGTAKLSSAARRYVLRMVSMEPSRRPADETEVAAALDELLRTLELPSWRRSVINGTVLAASALIAAIAIFGGMELWKRARREPPATASGDHAAGNIERDGNTDDAAGKPPAGPEKPNTDSKPKPEAPEVSGTETKAKAAGPVLLKPGEGRSGAGFTALQLFTRHGKALASLDFRSAAEEAEGVGLAEIAASMRAAEDRVDSTVKAWSAGQSIPPARCPAGELVSILRVGEGKIEGRSTAGIDLTIPVDELDVGPLFTDLAGEHRVRATWAARGPVAGARTAADVGLPAEGWWLVDAALTKCDTELANLGVVVDQLMGRPAEPYRSPAAPPMPGYDLPPTAKPLKLDVAIGTEDKTLGRTEDLAQALTRSTWWTQLMAIDSELETRRARVAAEAAAWRLFLARKDAELARSYSTTAAFVRAVERAARERRSKARNILRAKTIMMWPYVRSENATPPTFERKPEGEGDHILVSAPAGAMEIGPEDYKIPRRVTYIGVHSTLRRKGAEASLWVRLAASGDGACIELVAPRGGAGEVALTPGAGAHSVAPDIFDDRKVVEHAIELVAMDSVAVMRVDGNIVFVTPWTQDPATWPRIGLSGIEGEVAEILECSDSE